MSKVILVPNDESHPSFPVNLGSQHLTIIEQDGHFTSRNCKIWKDINITSPYLNTPGQEEEYYQGTHQSHYASLKDKLQSDSPRMGKYHLLQSPSKS